MELIYKIYFSLFAFSLIVLVDLLIKFKRPLILKIYFILMVVSAGSACLLFTLDVSDKLFFYALILFKGIIASSLANVFSILYFPKTRAWTNTLSLIFIVLIAIMYFYFNINAASLSDIHYKAMPLLINEKLGLPFIINLYRILIVLLFLGTLVYFSFGIIKKLQYKNIYFDKIRNWSIFVLVFSVTLLSVFFLLPLFGSSQLLRHTFTITIYLYILLLVYYRPNFLNKSSMKISLGESFNKEYEYGISELDFINEFYTKAYFTKNVASLEHLAGIMNIGSNDLYKFIYYKYSMKFNDLVNKNRVDYFIDIIHDPKYLNFTIDALAKEAGFSSRQHLYKPFKKFHGGNPSDIIDAIAH